MTTTTVSNDFLKKIWAAAIGERPPLDGKARWQVLAYYAGGRVYDKKHEVVPASKGLVFIDPPKVVVNDVDGESDINVFVYDPEDDLVVTVTQPGRDLRRGFDVTVKMPRDLVTIG